MSDTNAVTCLRCQRVTVGLGQLALVTGGSGPAAKIFLGQLAEVGGRNWDVRRVSMYALRARGALRSERHLPERGYVVGVVTGYWREY
jgi:hypothetical protein